MLPSACPQSGAAVNTALILKTEATRLQAEASDQWADYQAKGIRSVWFGSLAVGGAGIVLCVLALLR